MDSFFLAEMFKYLFLLFAEEEDLPFNVEDYIFTTEAHLLPLSLSTASNSHAPPVVNTMVLHISITTVLLASLWAPFTLHGLSDPNPVFPLMWHRS